MHASARKLRLIPILAAFVLLSSANACAGDPVAKAAGLFESPKGACAARLVASRMGGHLRLLTEVGAAPPRWMADDVTGLAWIDERTLVYTASPIHGKPGVFAWNCLEADALPRRLVGPTNIEAGSPDGTDYFELRSLSGREVEYYYAAKVDETDFANFRVDANVRRITVE
jgi:hypothetical protein